MRIETDNKFVVFNPNNITAATYLVQEGKHYIRVHTVNGSFDFQIGSSQRARQSLEYINNIIGVNEWVNLKKQL